MKKKLLKIYLLLLFPYTSYANTNVSLDSHIHFNLAPIGSELHSNTILRLDNMMKESWFEKAFILSGAYQMPLEVSERIDELNKRTSEVISHYPNKLLGLCGIGFPETWSHAIQNLNKCLDYKQMIGIKIRSVDLDKNKNKLMGILKSTNKVKVVLIHFKNSNSLQLDLPATDEDAENVNEIISKERVLESDLLQFKAFVDIVKLFPTIQFIVAHSLYSPNQIMALANEIKNKKLNNVWMETSTALSLYENGITQMRLALQEQYVNAWKVFGIEKILFGSDVLNRTGFTLGSAKEEYNDINSNKFLTEIERKMILQDNGKKMMELLK
jgi:predicted TIM-barrel fold metal-dependent hydrolase